MPDDVSVQHLDKMEIVCIDVLKVYDFCFQSERRENNCYPLDQFRRDRGACQIEPGEIASISCEIINATCQEIDRGTPNEEGRANVTFAVTTEATATIFDNEGNTCTQTRTFGFTKTVVLCAPEGTQTQCFIPSFSCGPCMVMGDQVCCTFDLCIVIQSFAPVKLLVPSFGFCTPKVCEQVSPGPPLVCPPQLFPPQCPNNDC